MQLTKPEDRGTKYLEIPNQISDNKIYSKYKSSPQTSQITVTDFFPNSKQHSGMPSPITSDRVMDGFSTSMKNNDLNQITVSDFKNSKAYINAMKALQQKIKSLEDQMQALHLQKKEELGQKDLEVEQLQVHISQLSQQIEIEKESKYVIEQSVMQEKDVYSVQERKLLNTIQQLENENLHTKDQVADLTAELRITEKKASEFQKLMDKQKSEIIDYCKDKQELSKMVNFLNAENDQYKSQIAKLQQQIVDLSNDQNENYRQLLEKFSQSQLSQQDKLIQMEGELKFKNQRIEELELVVAKQQQAQNQIQDQSLILQDHIEEKSKILQNLQSTQFNLDMQRQKCQDLLERNEKLETKLKDYKQQISLLKQVNDKYHYYNQAQQDVNQQLIQTIRQSSQPIRVEGAPSTDARGVHRNSKASTSEEGVDHIPAGMEDTRRLQISTQLSPSAHTPAQQSLSRTTKNTPLHSKRNSHQSPVP